MVYQNKCVFLRVIQKGIKETINNFKRAEQLFKHCKNKMAQSTITPEQKSLINEFMSLNIEAKQFAAVMSQKYDYYYDNGDDYSYNDVELFDALLIQRGTPIRSYIDEVCKARMDIMSSDRECASFIAAIHYFVYENRPDNETTPAVVPDSLLEEYTGAGCTFGRCKNTKYIQFVRIVSPWGKIKFLYRGSMKGAFEEVKKQFDGWRLWGNGPRKNTLLLWYSSNENAELIATCEQLEAAGLKAAAIDWAVRRTAFPEMPLQLPAITESAINEAAARIRANYEAMKEEQPSPLSVKKADTPHNQKSDMLQDWGEKIGGARKDEAQPHNNNGATITAPAKALKYGLTCRDKINEEGEKITRWYLMVSPSRYSLSVYIDMPFVDISTDIFRLGDESTEKAEKAFIEKYPNFDNYYKFDIYQVGYNKEFVIEAKRVKIRVATFDSLKAARDYMNSDRPAADLAAIKANQTPEERKKRAAALIVRNSINRPRVGTDYAQGRNITPEELATRFGLRAVEFGNWMNADDRQTSINECYSSFRALAELLGVPDEKIGRGTLAVAFGARGTGKANAHYEPAKHVINLTRTRGAGSLAHEWAHSIDFNGSNQKSLSNNFYFMGYTRRCKETGSYWGREEEQFARAFETAIHYELKEREVVDDYLVNIIEDCKVYPSATENSTIGAYVINKIKEAL